MRNVIVMLGLLGGFIFFGLDRRESSRVHRLQSHDGALRHRPRPRCRRQATLVQDSAEPDLLPLLRRAPPPSEV